MDTFRELYQRHYPDVYRFALFLSGDPSAAEDLAADTFVRAWTSRDRILHPTIKAYLFAITRNLYRDTLRRRRPTVTVTEKLPDPMPSAEQLAADASALQAVVERLKGASRSDRQALVLHAIRGLSYAEVAAELGTTTGAVKSRIFRMREALATLGLRRKGASR
jgi:RNA polymerase sigma-70 factor (ECF subfamily)